MTRMWTFVLKLMWGHYDQQVLIMSIMIKSLCKQNLLPININGFENLKNIHVNLYLYCLIFDRYEEYLNNTHVNDCHSVYILSYFQRLY